MFKGRFNSKKKNLITVIVTLETVKEMYVVLIAYIKIEGAFGNHYI